MPTTDEVKIYKELLSEKILILVKEFEAITGARVESIMFQDEESSNGEKEKIEAILHISI